VSQNGDFELRLGRCAVVRPEQAEDAAQKEIEERADHGAALSQIGLPLPLSRRDRDRLPHGFCTLQGGFEPPTSRSVSSSWP
jgi:hypothetical protein